MYTIPHENGARLPSIKIYPDKFAGHVIVITGSGSGIGEATARLFAQQGAQVMMLDIDKEKLIAVQASIQAAGYQADTYLCDVGDEQSVSTAIEETIKKYHKIDGILNL